jgi:hypothetical protein
MSANRNRNRNANMLHTFRRIRMEPHGYEYYENDMLRLYLRDLGPFGKALIYMQPVKGKIYEEIEEISLVGMGLIKLHPEVDGFVHFPNLRRVDLSYNYLDGITIPNVPEVNLSHNYLRNGSMILPETLDRLTRLDISDNLFTEDPLAGRRITVDVSVENNPYTYRNTSTGNRRNTIQKKMDLYRYIATRMRKGEGEEDSSDPLRVLIENSPRLLDTFFQQHVKEIGDLPRVIGNSGPLMEKHLQLVYVLHARSDVNILYNYRLENLYLPTSSFMYPYVSDKPLQEPYRTQILSLVADPSQTMRLLTEEMRQLMMEERYIEEPYVKGLIEMVSNYLLYEHSTQKSEEIFLSSIKNLVKHSPRLPEEGELYKNRWYLYLSENMRSSSEWEKVIKGHGRWEGLLSFSFSEYMNHHISNKSLKTIYNISLEIERCLKHILMVKLSKRNPVMRNLLIYLSLYQSDTEEFLMNHLNSSHYDTLYSLWTYIVDSYKNKNASEIDVQKTLENIYFLMSHGSVVIKKNKPSFFLMRREYKMHFISRLFHLGLVDPNTSVVVGKMTYADRHDHHIYRKIEDYSTYTKGMFVPNLHLSFREDELYKTKNGMIPLQNSFLPINTSYLYLDAQEREEQNQQMGPTYRAWSGLQMVDTESTLSANNPAYLFAHVMEYSDTSILPESRYADGFTLHEMDALLGDKAYEETTNLFIMACRSSKRVPINRTEAFRNNEYYQIYQQILRLLIGINQSLQKMEDEDEDEEEDSSPAEEGNNTSSVVTLSDLDATLLTHSEGIYNIYSMIEEIDEHLQKKEDFQERFPDLYRQYMENRVILLDEDNLVFSSDEVIRFLTVMQDVLQHLLPEVKMSGGKGKGKGKGKCKARR